MSEFYIEILKLSVFLKMTSSRFSTIFHVGHNKIGKKSLLEHVQYVGLYYLLRWDQ